MFTTLHSNGIIDLPTFHHVLLKMFLQLENVDLNINIRVMLLKGRHLSNGFCLIT